MMIFSKAICLFSIFSIVASKPISTSQARADDVGLVGNRRAELNITVGSVLDTLHGQVNTILPQIQNLANVNKETLSPLIDDLTGALDNAAHDLHRIHASGRVHSTTTRQCDCDDDDDTANLIAEIVKEITVTLDNVVVVANDLPVVGPLFYQVDRSLNGVLSGVEKLVSGALNLVSVLLGNVAGLLESVGLGLTRGALGH
ncbi:hypothetical protein D9758_014850 [Tetrapyrgos nigripes]|uniref:DUF6987 domain-containing protein n=1 Tax=Tetrapyrgos nigripes TaxID=182062 RepID=A0A8H5CTJ7_9AGAR|nr:hypothetical protein D9758_014850 [Tetrapyrgos nigripes]